MTDQANAVAMQSTGSLIGAVVGDKWRIRRRLGAGDLAVVFEAVAPDGRSAAVHVLRPELAQDEQLATGFLRAAREPWGHEDSVRILANGRLPDGAPYVVGELLEGETVARLVARRARGVSPTEALRIVRDALVVLESAHEADVVHGDLSPRRLFVSEDGTVKLMGFGLAPVRQRAAELGALESALEVAFAAPERLRGGPASVVGDLWSMSAVLFRLITGELVYGGDTTEQQRASAAERAPRSLAAIVPGAPDILLRLLERGLAIDPQLRFQSARDMRAATNQALVIPRLATLRSLYELESIPPASGPVSTRQPDSAGVVQVESKRDGGVVLQPATSLVPGPARATRGTADTMPAMPAARTPSPRLSADDVEGLIEALRALFLALETAVATRRHAGPGHPGTQRALTRVLEHMQALHAGANVLVGWSVTPRGFVLGGKTVWEPEGELERIPAELFAGGVRRLELAPGMESEELERLVDALQPGATDAQELGGGLATLIRVQAFAHLSAQLADAFASRMPGRRNT